MSGCWVIVGSCVCVVCVWGCRWVGRCGVMSVGSVGVDRGGWAPFHRFTPRMDDGWTHTQSVAPYVLHDGRVGGRHVALHLDLFVYGYGIDVYVVSGMYHHRRPVCFFALPTSHPQNTHTTCGHNNSFTCRSATNLTSSDPSRFTRVTHANGARKAYRSGVVGR